jgi:hypothetical protein
MNDCVETHDSVERRRRKLDLRDVSLFKPSTRDKPSRSLNLYGTEIDADNGESRVAKISGDRNTASTTKIKNARPWLQLSGQFTSPRNMIVGAFVISSVTFRERVVATPHDLYRILTVTHRPI